VGVPATRFDVIPDERSPPVVKAHDGSILVICLKDAGPSTRQRSVRH